MATTSGREKHQRAALAAVTLVAVLGACRPNASGSDETRRPIAVGELVPEVTVRTLEGDSARIAPGEPITLLHVWETLCGPCQQEIPEIEALQREFGPRGLRIVAVSVDDSGDDPVRAFARELGVTFEIGRDPEGAVRRLYRGTGVPESYLISADGRLIARQFGTLGSGATGIRAAIEQALGEAPQPPPTREVRRASA
jgi:cytochrome c biogenesis protein CcmG/thiol:disulfide interchange protein DsbE